MASESEERDPTRWVQIEHEHYIPLPANLMLESLAETVPDEKARKRFHKIATTLQLLIKHQYHEISEELKSSYEIFDPVNSDMSIDLPTEQIEQKEDDFLRHFLTVMEKANFSLLSAEELESAQAADYMFTLPIEISFENLDDRMLGRFLAGSGWSGKGTLPEFAKNILLFKRGSGIDKTEQVLAFDKVDQWIVRGIQKVKDKVNKVRGKEPKPSPLALTGAAAAAAAEDEAGSSIHQSRWVERINLQTMELKFPTSFYTATPMQEPTYDRIIILYRTTNKDERAANKVSPIYVKQFKHIPMADLDVVFPDKKVSMTTLDLIILSVGVLLGVYLILSELYTLLFAAPKEGAEDEGPWGFLAVLMSVGVLISKSVVSYQTSKERYHSLVTSSLYEKNMDSDRGVFFYLINSLEEQEFMETLLGYYTLFTHGGMTEGQLDRTCEELLKERFAAEVDFEVGDSLDKLKAFGLLERGAEARGTGDGEGAGASPDTVYEVVGLREAHQALYDMWCAAVPKPKKKKSKDSSHKSKTPRKTKSLSRTSSAADTSLTHSGDSAE